ncbi:mannosyl-3-phosphoglycerate phosphatase-related protein [Arenicella sp. 4NH20-0111]|uniref:HAD-IIB family hydrolase n=1 Tax=Arenicella sp. 4NH20-0111 TaxID=3127648 RepID=UPI0031093EF3
MNFWVSSDLDGTLIDHHTYSFSSALSAIALCKENNVPILLNTSKTYSETEKIHQQLGLDTPLIIENGSAIVLPSSMPLAGSEYGSSILKGERHHIRFGAPRSEILKFLSQVRTQTDFKFEGFNDWTPNQVSDQTGLNLSDSKLALMKEYSEPFIWQDSERHFDKFESMSLKAGFKVLKGGRFFHLMGNTDKAKPLQWLRSNAGLLFPGLSSSASSPALICLGDSQNDIAMLNVADVPVCVRSPVSPYPKVTTSKDVVYTKKYGPEGWAEAINAILPNQTRT